MVLILDGKLEHDVHRDGNKVFLEEKYSICDCFRSNRVPETDQVTEIAPYVHTYF